MREIFDLHFLETEYQITKARRIDSLAIDDYGCPVIIEYKLTKDENVINQALSYLKWLKEQKVEFFMMLVQNKKLDKKILENVRKNWHSPKVICIAENYNRFDLDTLDFISVDIQLYKYSYYGNEILHLEPLNLIKTEKHKISVAKTKEANVSSETISNLLSKATASVRAIADELRIRIMLLDESIEERPASYYIAYRLSKNFAEIHIDKTKVKIFLRPVEYDDPRNIVEKIPDSYNWTINRRVYIDNIEDVDYIMQLIEKSYRDVL